MPPEKKPARNKAMREEIMRSMMASFRIVGISISEEVALRLLKKIELRLERPRG